MNRLRSVIIAVVASLLFLGGPSGRIRAQGISVKYSTVEQIKADIDLVPCKNEARLDAVRALFQRMGAGTDDMSLEKFKNVENLVITKRGESDERIVVGAHYDKVSEGCGAVDNWTGIVALAHLYRTLKPTPLKKTLIFVAFGKEESGLVGSHAMASAIPKEQIALYCAMINIDSLGMGRPQVADNLANPKLEALAERLATDMKMLFGHANVLGDSDSSSFRDKKIPAITLHGLTNEYLTLLHTSKDTVTKVNPVSVYLGYALVVAMVDSIAGTPCNAFR